MLFKNIPKLYLKVIMTAIFFFIFTGVYIVHFDHSPHILKGRNLFSLKRPLTQSQLSAEPPTYYSVRQHLLVTANQFVVQIESVVAIRDLFLTLVGLWRIWQVHIVNEKKSPTSLTSVRGGADIGKIYIPAYSYCERKKPAHGTSLAAAREGGGWNCKIYTPAVRLSLV